MNPSDIYRFLTLGNETQANDYVEKMFQVLEEESECSTQKV